MAGKTLCYIEVHLFLNENEKEKITNNKRASTKCTYQILDNDKCILFSPFLFQQSIQDWKSDDNDDNSVRYYDVNSLKKNFLFLKKEIYNLESNHSDICFKIEKLIEYIETNIELYAGIRLIY